MNTHTEYQIKYLDDDGAFVPVGYRVSLKEDAETALHYWHHRQPNYTHVVVPVVVCGY